MLPSLSILLIVFCCGMSDHFTGWSDLLFTFERVRMDPLTAVIPTLLMELYNKAVIPMGGWIIELGSRACPRRRSAGNAEGSQA